MFSHRCLLDLLFVVVFRNQEKCFICQRAVPLRDYSRHTELCIQRQASKSATVSFTHTHLNRNTPAGSRLQSDDVKRSYCVKIIRLLNFFFSVFLMFRRESCCRRCRKQRAEVQVSVSLVFRLKHTSYLSQWLQSETLFRLKRF